MGGHGEIKTNDLPFFGYVIGRCDAPDEENAIERIFSASDLIFSLFNIYESWGRYSFGNERWAEGQLWNGPYHFAFKNQEFLGDNHTWYDPAFSHEAWNAFPVDFKDILKLVPRVRKALRVLASHPLRSVLVKTLCIMQSAMINRDQSLSLLRYWSALEQLYGDENRVNKDYSRIIKRASFAENNPALAIWKLRHVSQMRNNYVHAGLNDNEAKTMQRYLRHLLSRHLDYLIFTQGHLKNHRQWLDFVDLPSEKDNLDYQRKLIDSRLKMLRGKQAAGDH